ncbi:MAG: TIGR03936 family radical SAM-associated protein, partial [Defluviitaleaceae bacterium]|nr:TIGR03936 family radical SAM-associated protein [Defluviitaleaceae bacterium]
MDTKIRLCFAKTDTLRFIGHLDFLKVFQQTIRRSALPIAYSQGFNPHQILSFALPLPLGMESAHDYADITLTTEVPYDEIVNRLNKSVPQGLHFFAAYGVTGPPAAAATIAADYKVTTLLPRDLLQA